MGLSPDDIAAALGEGPEAFKAPPPAAKRPARVVPSGQSTGGILGGLIDAMGEIDDPTIQKMAVSHLRQVNPMLATIPILPEEIEADTINRQRENARAIQEIQRSRYQNVVAFAIDNRDAQLPGDQANRTLQEYMNQRGIPGVLDQSLLDEPERLVAVGQELANLFGEDPAESQFGLTMGQLVIAGLPSAQKPLKTRGAEKAKSELSAIKTAQELTAIEGEEGAQPGRALIQGVEGQIEEQTGVDVTPGFNSEIDTPAGAQRLMQAYQQTIAAGQRDLGLEPSTLTDRFLAVHGDDLKDQLEESPFVEDARGNKFVLSGQKTRDVDPEAQGQLLELVDTMANQAGVPVAEMFQRLGLDFAGIEPQTRRSFRDTVLKQAEGGEAP